MRKFQRNKGDFTSSREGQQRAKRYHYCRDCLHNQTAKYKECPACGSTRRVFFPSRVEMERAAALMLAERMGKISNLEFHPRFDLIVNGMKICTYAADSRYVDAERKTIIEDVKPKRFMTAEAKLKIALFNAVFRADGLSITIIKGN